MQPSNYNAIKHPHKKQNQNNAIKSKANSNASTQIFSRIHLNSYEAYFAGHPQPKKGETVELAKILCTKHFLTFFC